MAEVVNREADTLVFHAVILVGFEKKHGDQGGLPVVAMDDVGPLVGFEHVLKSGFAEKGIAHNVVGIAIGGGAVEEIILRVGLNEEAFPSVDEAKINGTVNRSVAPGNPEVVVVDGEPPDTVVVHAVVLGQNDFDGVAANLKLTAQPRNNVAQAPHLDHRRTLGRYH
jgi:hypothetical protein